MHKPTAMHMRELSQHVDSIICEAVHDFSRGRAADGAIDVRLRVLALFIVGLAAGFFSEVVRAAEPVEFRADAGHE